MLKTIIALVILLTVTAAAEAQMVPELQSPSSQYWRYVTSSGEADFYHILKTQNRDIREMWDKAVYRGENLIVVTLKQYDCESGGDRLVQIITYTGHEITGNSSYNDSEWRYSKPNTIGYALLTAACGQRQREWTYVGETTKDVAYFMKLNSLSKRGPFLRTWSKTISHDETQSITLWEFDCGNRKLRAVQSTDYADNSHSTHVGDRWSFAVPETMGEILLDAACKAERTTSRKSGRNNSIR